MTGRSLPQLPTPNDALRESPPPPQSSRRSLLWAALALPVLGWVGLALGGAQLIKAPIERRASEALGRAVSIGGPLRLFVTPSSIYLSAGDVRIANADWAEAPDLLHVEAFKARFSTFDLLIGQQSPRAITLIDGALDLERESGGSAVNWSVGKSGSVLDPAKVRQFDADNLAIRYRDPVKQVDGHFALRSIGTGAIALTGNGKTADRSFTVNGTARSTDVGPLRFTVDAQTSGVNLKVVGESNGPFRLARAQMNATAQGEDFAMLAALAGIRLPTTPDFALQAKLSQGRGGWHFSRIEGRIGQTDLTGKLTLDQRGKRPRIVAELASKMLHLEDGAALIGLRNDLTPATSEDSWEMESPPEQVHLLPDANLSPEGLGKFDAVIDYAAQQISGTSQSASHLNMRLALVRGRLMISPASIDLAGGFVSSDILIDARRSPALARYDIRLSPTPAGRLLAGWGIAAQDSTALARGRIQLSGRGNTLRETLGNADGRIALILPAGSVHMERASGSELDMAYLRAAMFGDSGPERSDLNCGLIAFDVRSGIATADPILIDTEDHVLSGSGRLDLRAERLDLRLDVNGKHPSWSGRPSPLLIGGTLADPMVLREPMSFFRPTRFLGFSMMLPDFGAIFGFVDPAGAQAPDCGPLLRDQKEKPSEVALLR